MKNIKSVKFLISRIDIYYYIVISIALSAILFIVLDFIPKKFTHSVYIQVYDHISIEDADDLKSLQNNPSFQLENTSVVENTSVDRVQFIDTIMAMKYGSINYIANYMKDITVINKVINETDIDLSLSDVYRGISVEIINYKTMKLSITLNNKENIIKLREHLKNSIKSVNKELNFTNIDFISISDDSVEIFPTKKIKLTLSFIFLIALCALRFHFKKK